MRPFPLHPLLLAAFPVLFLWSQNADEADPGEVLPVVVAVVVGVLVVAAVLALALRDLRRGALAASGVALGTLAYGFVGLGSLPAAAGLAVLVVVLVGVVVLVARSSEERVRSATTSANVAGVVLVLAALVPAVAGAREGGGTAEPDASATEVDGTGPADAPGAAPVADARDIWYIVPDRYPRGDTLAEVFDLDNGAFLDALEAEGFDVLDDSVANYPKTAHSLAASLNLEYLDELEETVGDDAQDSWTPVYRLLRDHALGRALTDLGYRYIHLGMWWSPTQTAASADVTLNHDDTSEFQRAFTDTTAWADVQEVLGEGERDQRRWKYDHTAYQFDQLDRLAAEDPDGPRFVFAHLTIPHEPYVFDADGSWVPLALERERSREDNFTRQVRYANDRLAALVETLLAGDDASDPIIVLQSDEGPHPRARTGPSFRWDRASDEVLQEKLRILNALHLPGIADDEVPETMTPVNTFRLILSRYFGADLPPLPDESYIFPNEDVLYRFEEVTDRVR
ncbi:MAG: LTA synthase family protein [Actinobacteria bacterium]|nr:LTA synthase family protein [Actinomycetota bacterium]